MEKRLIMLEQEAVLDRMAKAALALPPMDESVSTGNIAKDDWVALRLLSLLLSLDVSNIHIRDVKRSLWYYERKYSTEEIMLALDAIYTERKNHILSNPESTAIRGLNNQILEKNHD